MVGGLSLVPGGGSRAAEILQLPSGLGERWRVPAPPSPTLSELFAGSPRDAGWAGFLLAQTDREKPLLWVQDRMAILESGRIYPPGLGPGELIHVEALSVAWMNLPPAIRSPAQGESTLRPFHAGKVSRCESSWREARAWWVRNGRGG